MKGKFVIVDQQKTGDYERIQTAIDAASGPTTIFIMPGVYREKLEVHKPNIRLLGSSQGEVKIVYGDYAKMLGADGQPIRTFASYTLLVATNDFCCENITIENDAGPGEQVGQAVAAYVDGDRVQFYHCSFIGHQDTLFTGPLPPHPIEGSDFGGPRDGLLRLVGRQYYYNCYLEGDVDFIFGSATAIFNECHIHSLERPGYITAPSTPEGEPFGYVFLSCIFTGSALPETVYLGRPWRDWAKVAVINCFLGKHIITEGWHDWNKEHARKTTKFLEYNSRGPGAEMKDRVSWSYVINEKEAQNYTLDKIFKNVGWLYHR